MRRRSIYLGLRHVIPVMLGQGGGAASFVNGAAWSVDGGALCTIRH
jgi:hypothetical protein